MKKDIEQLLVFLLPAILVERVLETFIQHFYGALADGDQKALDVTIESFPSLSIGGLLSFVSALDVLIGFLPVLVISIWLWKMERQDGGRPLLWALGAVFLKYWILLLFIGQRIYDKEKPT